MKNWKLEYQGVRKSFNEWGLSNLKCTRINQGIDKVVFKHLGQRIDDDLLFEAESEITIYCDDALWFNGLVTQVPGVGSRRGELQVYEVSGPWWYLENLVFQQGWMEVDVEERIHKVDTGRVILGQSLSGERMNAGAQIREVLGYASSQGAPFAIGEIDVDVEFPFDETKDISCAEAIKRVFRWCPDAVAYFNYSNVVPVFEIRRRANMPRVAVSLDDTRDVRITPRHDLQSTAVVLKYEKRHTQKGRTWQSTAIDAYPADATGREFKSIVLTIELDGSYAQEVKQDVQVRPISIDNAAWWKAHLPGLEGIPFNKISIRGAQRNGDLPNELTGGAIANWMNCKVAEDVIRAKVSYETEYEHVVDREVAIRVQSTDARAQTYSQMIAYEGGEAAPVGLAKRLYESISELAYDGEVQLEGEDVHLESYMGRGLKLEGGRKEWETMHAVVQRVVEDVDRGRVKITFGVPRHLGADDMVELLRVNRRRSASRNAARRAIKKMQRVGVLEQGVHSRIENSDRGAGQYKRMVFEDPKQPGCRVVLDVGDIKNKTEVRLQEEHVCENGELKTRLVLASSPYERGST